jgi:hypothetical protein
VLHGFSNALICRFKQVCLIDSIANDKHIIDADTNKQEGHQIVHTCSLASTVEAEAEACSIRKTDTEETHEGDYEAAVHMAEGAQDQDCVDCDKHDGDLDQLKISLDIVSKGSLETSLGENGESNVLSLFVQIVNLFD